MSIAWKVKGQVIAQAIVCLTECAKPFTLPFVITIAIAIALTSYFLFSCIKIQAEPIKQSLGFMDIAYYLKIKTQESFDWGNLR